MTDNNAGFSGSIDAAIEAAEAAARAEAEKEEAERVERIAKDEEERKARNRSRYVYRSAIVVAARELGAEASTEQDTNRLYLDGIEVGSWISFVEERTHITRYRSQKNGKLRITAGAFGERTSYPQRKDGTHSYNAIAAQLRGFARRKITSDAMERMKAKNQREAAAIIEEFKLSDYQGLIAPSPHTEGMVNLDFTKLYTKIITASPEHARLVLQTLRGFGVKLSYNDK